MAVKIAQAATDTVLQPVSWPDPAQLPGRAGGPTSGGMDHGERIAKLEGGFGLLKHGHLILSWSAAALSGLTLTAVGVLAAFQIFTWNRMDTLESRMIAVEASVDAVERRLEELPRTIVDELRRAEKTDGPIVQPTERPPTQP